MKMKKFDSFDLGFYTICVMVSTAMAFICVLKITYPVNDNLDPISLNWTNPPNKLYKDGNKGLNIGKGLRIIYYMDSLKWKGEIENMSKYIVQDWYKRGWVEVTYTYETTHKTKEDMLRYLQRKYAKKTRLRPNKGYNRFIK